MATTGGISPTRRQLLGYAGLLIAAGVAPQSALAQAGSAGRQRFGDAHVHLFNLSDLPARGFIKHTLIGPDQAQLGIFPAVLGLVDELRSRVVSASQELDEYTGPDQMPVLLPARYIYLRALEHIRRNATADLGSPGLRRLVRLFQTPLDLPQSYTLLLILHRRLAKLARRLGTTIEALLGIPPDDATPDFLAGGGARPLKSKAADRVLRRFANSAPPDCPEAPTDSAETSLSAIREKIRWIHLMLQPRHFLLKRYLQQTAAADLRPARIVNLLVDYDRWLEQGPHPDSAHDMQIRFWTRLARDYAGDVEIRTFAGFDPLKYAEQRLTEPSTHFDRLLGYFRRRVDPHATHAIHGFKLYPPMGFAPSGNDEAMLNPRQPPVRAVRELWDNNPRLRDRRIHEEVNSALVEFFRRCSGERIPVLAHAQHSNEAGKCFGARAAPVGWEPIVRNYPGLRLCLGHFAESADFLRGMQDWDHPERVPANSWAILGTGRLLALNSIVEAKVYADIGYMSEFLLEREGRGLRRATEFFGKLRVYCARFDPGCRHIVYGSDWVMLAQEPDHQRYVEVIREGMTRAGWSKEWQDRLLYGNLERFLTA